MQKADVPKVGVPFIPFFCNLAVFPTEKENDETLYYILKQSPTVPSASDVKVMIDYLPGHVYCFFPSIEENRGKVAMFSSRPDFLKRFSYSLEIDKRHVVLPSTSSEVPQLFHFTLP